MSDQELLEFKSNPYWQDAIRLRIWDDLAKEPEAETPPLDHYRIILEQVSL